MRILVLSQLEQSPGTDAFLEVARAAGHEVERVDPLALRLALGDGPVAIRGLNPAAFDVVFTRMGSATPERGFDVLRHLELSSLPCINRAAPLRVARDKIRTYVELASAGLPLPRSIVADSGRDVMELENELGRPPWVWKDPIGTKGTAVVRVESQAQLASLIANQDRFLLQRFVAEANGADVRVFVVNGRPVAAMRRQAAPGEWRSNLHLGGEGAQHELTKQEASVAASAAQTIGLDVAGVDLLPGADGPLVAEVNGSPGLAGLRKACGESPIHEILDCLAARSMDSPAESELDSHS